MWHLHRLNSHRTNFRNLPPIQSQKRGRKHQGKRAPLPPEKIKAYIEKKRGNWECVWRQHYSLQKKRVVERVFQKEGKTRYEELTAKGKRQVEEIMRAYDFEERRGVMKERWLQSKQKPANRKTLEQVVRAVALPTYQIWTSYVFILSRAFYLHDLLQMNIHFYLMNMVMIFLSMYLLKDLDNRFVEGRKSLVLVKMSLLLRRVYLFLPWVSTLLARLHHRW